MWLSLLEDLRKIDTICLNILPTKLKQRRRLPTPSDNIKQNDYRVSIAVVEDRVSEKNVEVDAFVQHPHKVTRLDVLQNDKHYWTNRFL